MENRCILHQWREFLYLCIQAFRSIWYGSSIWKKRDKHHHASTCPATFRYISSFAKRKLCGANGCFEMAGYERCENYLSGQACKLIIITVKWGWNKRWKHPFCSAWEGKIQAASNRLNNSQSPVGSPITDKKLVSGKLPKNLESLIDMARISKNFGLRRTSSNSHNHFKKKDWPYPQQQEQYAKRKGAGRNFPELAWTLHPIL